MKFNKQSGSAQLTAFRIILGIVLVALGLLGGVSLSMKEIPLALFGETATGVVRKVEEITTSTSSKWEYRNGQHQSVSRSSPSYFMTLAFTTKDGKPVEVRTLATFNTGAYVGDEHPLLYMPSHPENAKISTARQLWLPMLVGMLFTIGCIRLGFWLIMKKSASTKFKAASA